MASKKSRRQFNLKTVSKEKILKSITSIKKMHKKKSACSDGLTQEQLILGAETLSGPMSQIFNESIKRSICYSTVTVESTSNYKLVND